MTANHARLRTAAFVDRNRGRVIGVIAGRPVLAIAGGDGTEGGSSGAGDGAGGENAGGEPTGEQQQEQPRTFTQEQVSRMTAAEKRQGEQAAERRILAELGVANVADAKKALADKAEADRAAMTEAQRAQQDAEAARQQADQARAAAEQERRAAAIERQLVRAGIADTKVDRATKALDIADNADADAIKAAVEKLVEEEPTWFGKPEGAAGGAPNSHTGSRPPVTATTKTAVEAGAARYEQAKTTKRPAFI